MKVKSVKKIDETSGKQNEKYSLYEAVMENDELYTACETLNSKGQLTGQYVLNKDGEILDQAKNQELYDEIFDEV